MDAAHAPVALRDPYAACAAIAWDISMLTGLHWAVANDSGGPTLVLSASYGSWAQWSVSHVVRRNLLQSADIGYRRDDVSGVDPIEKILEAMLAAEFRLNRTSTLTGTLAFFKFDTSAAGSDCRAAGIVRGAETRPRTAAHQGR